MSQESMPEQFEPPSSPSTPNVSTRRLGESKESFQQSSARARQVKQAIVQVISSREELAKYLMTYDMQLLTSAVEYDSSHDYVKSSYILYLKHNNYLEPLSVFLERYPDYQPSIDLIVSKL